MPEALLDLLKVDPEFALQVAYNRGYNQGRTDELKTQLERMSDAKTQR